MRAVVQRVSRAHVEVHGKVVGEIGRGLLILLGVGTDDGGEHAEWLARKIASLRVFDDDEGRMNRSLEDVGGSVLCVSQFTLYGDTHKGSRPSFTDAAPATLAEELYREFCSQLRSHGVPVSEGIFGARMSVLLANDGPVTLLLER